VIKAIENSGHYPHIFRPLVLPHTTIANRVVMGSMHTGLEEDHPNFQRLAQFYKARAQSGVGTIITGGFSPNWAGRLSPFAGKLTAIKEVHKHALLTQTVHQFDTKLILQILHAGRYAFHPWSVAPSSIQSPITPFRPWKLTRRGVHSTIKDFVRCAKLAKQAGYDGVEIMGSEGYLINQFLVASTNQRQDEWGGDFNHRMQFAVEIVRQIREALGDDFIIIFRLSMLDLVPEGSAWPEIVALAKAIEGAGASFINTGIGWHEARIPTIASMVPQGAFIPLTRQMRPEVSLPLIGANRINTPEKAEEILATGDVDMVALARPFLADPAWVEKARHGHRALINVCIACNQACLDQLFEKKSASCLVNPFACREGSLVLEQTHHVKRLAVVGGGPAGMAFAKTAAERGHHVTLFEAQADLGGQFNLAKQIPGKADYQYTIDYYKAQLHLLEVDVKLNTHATVDMLLDYDGVIIAAGIHPRMPNIPGILHSSVMTYLDALRGQREIGERVAIIGAGGIGIDVATWLCGEPNHFAGYWGIDLKVKTPGGLVAPSVPPMKRQVTLLQRKQSKIGAHLGKTTGWIHRLELNKWGVQSITGVEYQRIDDQGLHLMVNGHPLLLAVDSIIVCAGQEERQDLYRELLQKKENVHLIGGAYKALELDAKQAIEQATRLGLIL
jgi:2,4-dienoyl-CoA reductase (NADPH2)